MGEDRLKQHDKLMKDPYFKGYNKGKEDLKKQLLADLRGEIEKADRTLSNSTNDVISKMAIIQRKVAKDLIEKWKLEKGI